MITDNEVIDALAIDLHAMALAGADVPSLLRHVQNVVGKKECRFESLKSFRKAFDTGIASISPIGGWCGFGGELSDAQVDSFVLPVVKESLKACPGNESGHAS
jgi:hypothetical protein